MLPGLHSPVGDEFAVSKELARIEALDRLYLVIGSTIENKGTAPCLGRGDLWTASELKHQRLAAALCEPCDVFTICADYITNYHEPEGVWAGLTPQDRGIKTTRPRKKKEKEND